MKQFIHSRFPKTVGLVLALSVGMVACGTTSTPAPTPIEQNVITGVSINNTSPIALTVGSTATITVTVTGTGTFDSTVTYNSSTPAVAEVNASGVVTAKTVGSTIITVTTADGKQTDTIEVTVTAGTPTFTPINVSFRPSTSTSPNPPLPALPSGYSADTGLGYSAARGYGWVTAASLANPTRTPIDIINRTRVRTGPANDLQKTFVIMAPIPGTQDPSNNAAWEVNVPNGSYTVTVSVGDNDAGNFNFDSTHNVVAEGNVTLIAAFKPTASQLFATGTDNVTVNDGRLTLSSAEGSNTKINYVTITANTASAMRR